MHAADFALGVLGANAIVGAAGADRHRGGLGAAGSRGDDIGRR